MGWPGPERKKEYLVSQADPSIHDTAAVVRRLDSVTHTAACR